MCFKKALLHTIGLIISAFVILYCWSPARGFGDGGFELVETKTSPSGSNVAEVFAYRGGATVRGFSILLIRPVHKKIPPESFDARVADCEGPQVLTVIWESNERVVVNFPNPEHRVLKPMYLGVLIEETKRLATK